MYLNYINLLSKQLISLVLAELPPRKKQLPNKCDLIYRYSSNKDLEDCQCSFYWGGRDDKGDPGNYKLMTLI